MASYNFRKKQSAKDFASRRRKKGFNCSLYKKDKGYGVSVTR